jgi:hypothetical protein
MSFVNDMVETAEVNHSIEHGEIAHTELRFILKPGIANIEAKTAIVDRLWNACSGPLPFICECDRVIADDHPNTNLKCGPAGVYVDRRGGWSIFRYRISCYICHWIMVKLGLVPAIDTLSQEAPAGTPSAAIPTGWQSRLSRPLCRILGARL